MDCEGPSGSRGSLLRVAPARKAQNPSRRQSPSSPPRRPGRPGHSCGGARRPGQLGSTPLGVRGGRGRPVSGDRGCHPPGWPPGHLGRHRCRPLHAAQPPPRSTPHSRRPAPRRAAPRRAAPRRAAPRRAAPRRAAPRRPAPRRPAPRRPAPRRPAPPRAALRRAALRRAALRRAGLHPSRGRVSVPRQGGCQRLMEDRGPGQAHQWRVGTVRRRWPGRGVSGGPTTGRAPRLPGR
ncbi:hypothetical protein J3R03_000707 [Actinoplanes couchii]|nr:hypothetical protein [Actinoplanes couchii]